MLSQRQTLGFHLTNFKNALTALFAKVQEKLAALFARERETRRQIDCADTAKDFIGCRLYGPYRETIRLE